MSSTCNNAAVDHRRKWDRNEYEQKARERLQEEFDKENGKKLKLSPEKRESLKYREHKVDIESKVGKSTIISKTIQSQNGGYYCKLCDCVVKDSLAFLDHINGGKHQKNLGMSMEVERSTLDQVKKRFEVMKTKKEDKKFKPDEYNIEKRLLELEEDKERELEKRKEKRKAKKRKAAEALEIDNQSDSEMAALMGFQGFGSSK